MPKIHKNPWSIRPIFAAHSWITTRISAYLHESYFLWLKLLENNGNSHVCYSTSDFLRRFESVFPTNEDFSFSSSQDIYFITADIEELYTNLKCTDILASIRFFGELLDIPNSQVNHLLSLTEILFSYSYFTHEDAVFQQINGIPMGTNAGPSLANLTLLRFGFFKCSQPNYFFTRYIDDILFAFRGTKSQALLTWNSLVSRLFSKFSLQLKVTGSGHEVDFLDVHLNSRTGSIGLYRKPSFNFNYVHSKSKHPRHSLVSWVKNEFKRILTICNSPSEYYSAVNTFSRELLKLDYSQSLCKAPLFSLNERYLLLFGSKLKKKKIKQQWIPWPYELKGLLKPYLEKALLRSMEYKGNPETLKIAEATTLNSSILTELQ
jgi:hypothetical protein